MPVIPATREAEIGESLEPGRWRLQRAKFTLLNSSLCDKSKTLSQKKTKQKEMMHKYQTQCSIKQSKNIYIIHLHRVQKQTNVSSILLREVYIGGKKYKETKGNDYPKSFFNNYQAVNIFIYFYMY